VVASAIVDNIAHPTSVPVAFPQPAVESTTPLVRVEAVSRPADIAGGASVGAAALSASAASFPATTVVATAAAPVASIPVIPTAAAVPSLPSSTSAAEGPAAVKRQALASDGAHDSEPSAPFSLVQVSVAGSAVSAVPSAHTKPDSSRSAAVVSADDDDDMEFPDIVEA
jgi:hypothetical protein